MKYYKLVNDIPMFKKGDLFFIHPEEGCLLQKDTLRLAYHKETLEKNPEILKDWFEEIEESEGRRWRAKYGEEYYHVDSHGNVICNIDLETKLDDYHYSIGDYSKVEEEAEAYKEYLIARQVLLDDAEGGKFTLKEQNYFAKYSVIDNRWHLNGDYHYTPGGIYFKDLESLKKSLKEHEEQWEIVRKNEMGEM